MMRPTPAEASLATERECIDIDYPADPLAFFAKHQFSGLKGWIDQTTAAALADELLAVHARMAAGTNQAIPFLAKLPWPISSLPDDVIRGLRLADLADLAHELLQGRPGRALSWQAFARKAGEKATTIHADGDFVPMSGPGVAFWIPLTPTPGRTGLVAITDIDGTGLRPVRQADQDPGDLTWHDLDVLHWAEDQTVDFVALGFGVFPDGECLDLSGNPTNAAIRTLIARRIFTTPRHGQPGAGPTTPLIASLPR